MPSAFVVNMHTKRAHRHGQIHTHGYRYIDTGRVKNRKNQGQPTRVYFSKRKVITSDKLYVAQTSRVDNND